MYKSCKTIAEIGCNHKGDMNIAKELISLAKTSGADVVKFQKRNVEKVYSKELRKRKSTIIFTSSVVTGLLGPLLYISAVVAGLS